MSHPKRIRLVVLDWAGTTTDFGCLAPTESFIRAFAGFGITVSLAEVREPMGLHKRDHVRALFQFSSIACQWQNRSARDWSESDVEAVYEEVGRFQLESLKSHSSLVPDLLPTIAMLRDRDIHIATTTGYFREAAELCYTVGREQGYFPDFSICADDVPQGRPAPWMMFRAMESLNIYPAPCVVKVGDTVADVQEGLNAGTWSIAVTDSSSDMGLTLEEWTQLSEGEMQARRSVIREKMLAVGAHAVIDSLSQLPDLIERVDARLQIGGEFVAPTRLDT